MKPYLKIAVLSAALAVFGAAPAVGHHRDAHNGPNATPGPKANLPSKAKAYGVYCRAEPKRRVPGMKGTPFSRCVTAAAKVANGRTENPKKACRGESKKRVAGMKRTPFATCVVAIAHLKRDLKRQEREEKEQDEQEPEQTGASA